MRYPDDFINKIICSDCLGVMRGMPDNCIDTIITDPPYGLFFMGRKWDYDVPSIEIWQECLRVLKPGGTALIFAGSRTQHRMAVNIEDAGFILKDCIMWIYGSGFPKATDISKQIDKRAKKDIKIIKEKVDLGNWLKEKRGDKPQKEISKHFLSKTGGLTGCVANEWDLEELQEWGIELPELEDNIEPDKKDDEIPEPPKEPKSKLGDLYQLGNHRLLCGDATRKEDVERLMDGKKASMVFTDPPYGIDYQDLKKRFNKILNDKENEIPKILKSIIRWENIPYYICCNWQSYPLFFMILKDLIDIKALIVWDKMRGVQNLDKYYKRHEFIIYSGAFGGEKTIEGDIWKLDREIPELHPTMKPIELCSKAIDNSSKISDIILDLFGGSGSALITCEKLNRVCYMMEIDPIYIDIIINRWENYTGKKAGKIDGR